MHVNVVTPFSSYYGDTIASLAIHSLLNHFLVQLLLPSSEGIPFAVCAFFKGVVKASLMDMKAHLIDWEGSLGEDESPCSSS